MRVIPLPREDAGLAGGMPYRQNSAGAQQPDVVAIQVKRSLRSSTSEDNRDANGQPLMYQSFQGPTRTESEGPPEGLANFAAASVQAIDRRKQVNRLMSKSESEKHECELNKDGHKHSSSSYFNSQNQGQRSELKVSTKEHIYDTPQLSPSQKSPLPAVMQKPGFPVAGATAPLTVNTAADADHALKPSSPGGKKKVPPPPPKRTHSIREDAGGGDSTPTSHSPNLTPASTITVSASVHSQPSTTPQPHSTSAHSHNTSAQSKQPPPIMQKPRPQPPPKTQHSPQQQQQQQQHQNQHPPVAQKPQSPKPALSPKMHPLASPQKTNINPNPMLTPTKSVNGGQQASILVKPKPPSTSQHTPQQFLQTKTPSSPLPSKAPTPLATSTPHVVPKPSQAGQQSPQPLSQPQHKSQPMSQQSTDSASQPFASCVKSLSEKFGSQSAGSGGGAGEEDQFPDNVSTDSDDFPPPPPPIAMDIITPKIHNYGIPSRNGKEFGLQRDFGKGRGSPVRNFNMSPGLGAGSPPASIVHGKTPARTAGPGFLSGGGNASPLAGNPLLHKPPNHSSHRGSASDHEKTPEPEMFTNEKRSDSTTSFDSNISTSSVDSNTLPFANENVGTIKSRAPVIKGSIITSDLEEEHRNIDLNPDMFAYQSEHSVASHPTHSPHTVSGYAQHQHLPPQHKHPQSQHPQSQHPQSQHLQPQHLQSQHLSSQHMSSQHPIGTKSPQSSRASSNSGEMTLC